MFAYVGSRTSRERNARGEGISLFRMDENSGDLHFLEVTGNLINPSYQTISLRHRMLYTVHGDQETVSAFSLDEKNGHLTFINQICCEGLNPVHLALDPTENQLIISNHLSGSLALISIDPSGALNRVCQLVKLQGEPGPHRKEQPFSKPHFNLFDPTGQFVVVPDKGLDRVFSFKLKSGELVACESESVQFREGSGPRHLVFHSNLPLVYVLNELNSTITACQFSSQDGSITPFQIVSTLSDSFTGDSRAAGIQISSDCRFAYASNRGEDSIAVFEITPENGRLRLVQTAPAGGRTPRFFAISPGGNYLYCLNEDSDTITLMEINKKTGRLSDVQREFNCASAVCMTFFRA